MKLKNVRSRFYFSLYQHNAQSLYADPVNDKNSCDPYCRCNSFRTEKKKNFQCRTSWNNEPRRIFHQHDHQPLRLGAKKTEGAQKDCRGEMTRDYQLIKFTHSIGSFDKFRNRVVSVFWCSVCRNAVIAPLNVELVETRNVVIELVENVVSEPAEMNHCIFFKIML